MINLSNLVIELQKRIDSSNNSEEVIVYSKILQKLNLTAFTSVSDYNNLPTENINQDDIFYVESENSLVVRQGEEWYTMDGRLLEASSLSGILWSWGQNATGTLGDETFENRSSPVTISGGGTTWCQATPNGGGFTDHRAAIKTDGTLWTWGKNNNGQLGIGTITGECRTSPGTTAGGGTNWCGVAGTAEFVYGIKTDGTLWTWGCDDCYGMLGGGTLTATTSPITILGGGTNWCQVSTAGIIFGPTAALKSDGTLWTWGRNCCGYLGDGTATDRSSPGTTAGGGTNWCCVSVGTSYLVRSVMALKTDGTLWTWGQNKYGQLGDGTIEDRSSPVTTVGGGTDWCAIGPGGDRSFAIKTDGTLWAWGGNNCGFLVDGTTICRSSPVTIAGGGTNWRSVVSNPGLSTSFSALKTDGTLWVWGNNNYGQVGDGTNILRSSPVTIAGGGTNWIYINGGTAISLP